MLVKLTTDMPDRKRFPAGKSKKTPESGGVPNAPRSPFMEILEEILPQDKIENRDLHQLWSDLPGAERNLLDAQSEENFKNYKDLVTAIARATLQRNVRIRKMKRKNSRNETVELSILEIIDNRLQKMAIMMHSRENSAFALLKTVEEIRGILFDARQ